MGISIGLVGLGAFGRCFADLFYSHPLVDRVALCDTEPDRIQAFTANNSWKSKFNPRDAYTSFDDICKADLDALVVITQHWLHAPQCVQAMEAGKHVYSAVPVITIASGDATLEWCDRLVRTARRTGRRYMLGETTYYRAESMFCRRQASKGAFGAFTYGEGEYFHNFDSLFGVITSRLASQSGKEYERTHGPADFAAGVLDAPMHYPTHSTSGPIGVMGAHAVKVSAFGQKFNALDPRLDGLGFANETALFQMSNGATMRVCEHRECSLGREVLRVYGTDGSYENGRWLSSSERMELTDEQMRDPLPQEVQAAFAKAVGAEGIYGGHGGSHVYLVHEFVDAVAHDRQPAINVWEAVRYMAAGVMAHKSALRDGEILSVPDWGDAPQ